MGRSNALYRISILLKYLTHNLRKHSQNALTLIVHHQFFVVLQRTSPPGRGNDKHNIVSPSGLSDQFVLARKLHPCNYEQSKSLPMGFIYIHISNN
jgi:hypothetical protein